MKYRRKNEIFFFSEMMVYTVSALFFAIIGHLDIATPEQINIIYIVFITLSFSYLFSFELFLKKHDSAVHYKMLKKYYIPTGKEKTGGYKRKGVGAVIVLWIAYLLCIATMKYRGILSWHVFLIGACFMFALNSFFIRKVCLLSVLFLHNKNNCCKNCGINSWDYAIFASSLIFAPELSTAATIINWIIIVIAFVELLIWEILYYKYPYRFYSETNRTLRCSNCMKQCKFHRND